MFYILEGEGYDIHDNKERFDWQAGDVVIVPPGVVHRHYNKSETNPIVALVINPKPLYLHLNLVNQKLLEPPFNPAHPDGDGSHGSRGG
jgi:quercetin dioxygenase-like cupin family protein